MLKTGKNLIHGVMQGTLSLDAVHFFGTPLRYMRLLGGSPKQWYSNFFALLPPHVISLQLCISNVRERNGTPKSNVLTFGSPDANLNSGPNYSLFITK
jgi:hypothetical protein